MPTTPEATYGDVPFIDPETGRFPDEFAPESVALDAKRAEDAAAAASAAKVDVAQVAAGIGEAVSTAVAEQVATNVDPKLTVIESARGEAVEAAGEAVAAKGDAVAAAARAEAVPVTNDAIMAPILADPDSQSGAQLRNTFDEAIGSKVPALLGPAVIRPNTWSSIGDSISASANYVTNGSGGKNAADNAWQHWANVYLGQRLEPPVGYAVSGKRTDQMRTEQLPQVLANPTTYCTLMGGTNDIPFGRSELQIIADLQYMIQALVGAGIRPIVGEITPRADPSALTASGQVILQKVNAWIRQVAPRLGAWVIPWYSSLANTDGTPKANVLHDGLHPGAFGAEVMGRKFAQVVDRLIPRVDRLPASNAESPDVAIVANPMMTGTGGTLLVAGVTGTAATGWSASAWSGQTADAVLSKEARTDDVPGEWQKVAVANDNSAQVYQSVTNTARWATGDQFEAFVEVEADTSLIAPTGFEVMTLCQPSGRQSFAMAIAGPGTAKATPHAGVISTPPVLRVPPITIPADTTQVWLLVRVKGDTGSLRIGRATLQKIR